VKWISSVYQQALLILSTMQSILMSDGTNKALSKSP